jgi:glycolate oxidase subunit GlcD
MSLSAALKAKLVAILSSDRVKDDAVTRYAYQADGLTLHPSQPAGVIFPHTTEELSACVKAFNEAKIPFLPRGAGTGLSGGAVPKQGAVIIEMCHFRKVRQIDVINRIVEVEAGVVNIDISNAISEKGFHFVPDPSSQKACTIGGNVAENSGGPHTLKYGVTVNHVLGLEVVMADGSVVTLGGQSWSSAGPDLLGLFIGSEGTFGIVTAVKCRMTPLPEDVRTMLVTFTSVATACKAVSAIIAAGIVPAALEMIDKIVIGAVEEDMGAGFPQDAEALLIIELEDLRDGLDDQVEAMKALLDQQGAQEVRIAEDAQQRAQIWQARKGAFGAMGRVSPSFYTQDGVIPRGKLPEVLEKVFQIGDKYGLTIANVFHAGDGNLHPLILYDSQNPKEIEATHEAGREILETCLSFGGALSGEHGIGLEKAHLMTSMFTDDDLDNMIRVRAVFNPQDLLNPGKIFPTPSRCSEVKMVRKKTGIAV